jgi:hypothetical protein
MSVGIGIIAVRTSLSTYLIGWSWEIIAETTPWYEGAIYGDYLWIETHRTANLLLLVRFDAPESIHLTALI